MTQPTLPLYRQIAADLLLKLDNGAWPPGTRLPPVRQLADTYHVNNLTALQAYRWLEEQQRVVARARSGFYAAARPLTQDYDQENTLPSPGAWVHVDDRVANLMTLSSSALKVQLHMAEADNSLYPAAELARRLAA